MSRQLKELRSLMPWWAALQLLQPRSPRCTDVCPLASGRNICQSLCCMGIRVRALVLRLRAWNSGNQTFGHCCRCSGLADQDRSRLDCTLSAQVVRRISTRSWDFELVQVVKERDLLGHGTRLRKTCIARRMVGAGMQDLGCEVGPAPCWKVQHAGLQGHPQVA